MSLVHLKNKKNGVTYVYESVGHWDKDKQQSRSERVCIGKLDPVTGVVIPNRSRTGVVNAGRREPSARSFRAILPEK